MALHGILMNLGIREGSADASQWGNLQIVPTQRRCPRSLPESPDSSKSHVMPSTPSLLPAPKWLSRHRIFSSPPCIPLSSFHITVAPASAIIRAISPPVMDFVKWSAIFSVPFTLINLNLPLFTISCTHKNLNSTCFSLPSPLRLATDLPVSLSVHTLIVTSIPMSTPIAPIPNASAHPVTIA
jgi:hypothetical protein